MLVNLRQLFRLAACALIVVVAPAIAQTPNRVTILYDAFGRSSKLTKDWGFAAAADVGCIASASVRKEGLGVGRGNSLQAHPSRLRLWSFRDPGE